MTMRGAVRRGTLAATLVVAIVFVIWAASVFALPFVLPRITAVAAACSAWIVGIRRNMPAPAWDDFWKVVLALILQIVLGWIFNIKENVKEMREEIGDLAREVRSLRGELIREELRNTGEKPS